MNFQLSATNIASLRDDEWGKYAFSTDISFLRDKRKVCLI